jgi:hypothetical protein
MRFLIEPLEFGGLAKVPLTSRLANKEIARALSKMQADLSGIFWTVCKRRRRGAIAFLDKLVLGSFCLLGFGLFAGCGCVRCYLDLERLETAGNGSKRVILLPICA